MILPPLQNNAVKEIEESDDIEENSTILLNDSNIPSIHLNQ
jgi:hypothetical protein